MTNATHFESTLAPKIVVKMPGIEGPRMIREVEVYQLQTAVQQLIAESVYHLPASYLQSLAAAQDREQSPLGQQIILTLRENAHYAKTEQIPTCQDTGMAIIYLEVGQHVHFTGGDLNSAMQEGVRLGYSNLRKSVVADPLHRTNTGDNTPPILHTDIVPGDQVQLTLLMKGFGAEMMSRLRMLPPAAGVTGVKQLAKKALLRPLGQPNPAAHLAQLEQELLDDINDLGIGPQGLGGSVTALAVHIESFPTHIAALPVAVNLNCSAPRKATIII
jgi:fumarate hydratase subunit alpha